MTTMTIMQLAQQRADAMALLEELSKQPTAPDPEQRKAYLDALILARRYYAKCEKEYQRAISLYSNDELEDLLQTHPRAA